MGTSILKQRDYLIATVQSDLSDEEWQQFQDDLVRRIGLTRARAVVIDVTEIDVLDSYAARILGTTVEMVRLRGAEAIIVGIQPDVAFAMVQLGLTLDRVTMALDLEDGLEYLDSIGPRRRHSIHAD